MENPVEESIRAKTPLCGCEKMKETMSTKGSVGRFKGE
jgi:hypothetical protein